MAQPPGRPTLVVCVNRRSNPSQPSCGARGGAALAARLRTLVISRGLDAVVEESPCLGQCADGPNLRIAPGGRFFHRVGEADLDAVLAELERL